MADLPTEPAKAGENPVPVEQQPVDVYPEVTKNELAGAYQNSENEKQYLANELEKARMIQAAAQMQPAPQSAPREDPLDSYSRDILTMPAEQAKAKLNEGINARAAWIARNEISKLRQEVAQAMQVNANNQTINRIMDQAPEVATPEGQRKFAGAYMEAQMELQQKGLPTNPDLVSKRALGIFRERSGKTSSPRPFPVEGASRPDISGGLGMANDTGEERPWNPVELAYKLDRDPTYKKSQMIDLPQLDSLDMAKMSGDWVSTENKYNIERGQKTSRIPGMYSPLTFSATKA